MYHSLHRMKQMDWGELTSGHGIGGIASLPLTSIVTVSLQLQKMITIKLKTNTLAS